MRTGWMNNPHLLIDKEPAIIHDKGMHQRWREECAEKIEQENVAMATRLESVRGVVVADKHRPRPPGQRRRRPGRPGSREPSASTPASAAPAAARRRPGGGGEKVTFAEGVAPAPAEEVLPTLEPSNLTRGIITKPRDAQFHRSSKRPNVLFREHLTIDGIRCCVTVKASSATQLLLEVDHGRGQRHRLSLPLDEAADVLGVRREVLGPPGAGDAAAVTRELRAEAWRQLALCVRPATPVRERMALKAEKAEAAARAARKRDALVHRPINGPHNNIPEPAYVPNAYGPKRPPGGKPKRGGARSGRGRGRAPGPSASPAGTPRSRDASPQSTARSHASARSFAGDPPRASGRGFGERPSARSSGRARPVAAAAAAPVAAPAPAPAPSPGSDVVRLAQGLAEHVLGCCVAIAREQPGLWAATRERYGAFPLPVDAAAPAPSLPC